MKYEVLRTFSGERLYKKDEVVELDGPHLEKLVAQRYLKPVEEPEPKPAAAAPKRK